MNTDALSTFIQTHAVESSQALAGRWFNIQVRPDVGSGERINAGVAFVDASEKLHVRMAQNFERLGCLYGEKVSIDSFSRLSGFAQELLSDCDFSALNLEGISPNLCRTETKYASGATIFEILAELYQATVSIDRPQEEVVDRAGRAKNISTETLRASIFTRLRERMGASAETYIPRSYYSISDSTGGSRRIDVPIRLPGKLAATVVSVWTKDEFKRKWSLAQAGLDLDTVHQNSPLEKLGLFVLRPAKSLGYGESELTDIDNEIDDVAWKLKRIANVNVDTRSANDELADTVAGWLKEAA